MNGQQATSFSFPTIPYHDITKIIIQFLYPIDTDDANDATPIARNFTGAYQCADAATKVAYMTPFVYPQDFRLLSAELIWSAAATGNMVWKIDIGVGRKGDDTNARTTGGTNVTTAAPSTANTYGFLNFDGIGGIDLKKIGYPDIVGIKFSRIGADASDTINNTVNIYGIKLTWI